MDKGSDDLAAVINEAIDLYNAGLYHKALPKFKSVVAMAEKAGCDQAAVDLYTWVIACHAHLEEVSAVECERIDEKLTFLRSLSMRKCCVCVTSGSR